MLIDAEKTNQLLQAEIDLDERFNNGDGNVRDYIPKIIYNNISQFIQSKVNYAVVVDKKDKVIIDSDELYSYLDNGFIREFEAYGQEDYTDGEYREIKNSLDFIDRNLNEICMRIAYEKGYYVYSFKKLIFNETFICIKFDNRTLEYVKRKSKYNKFKKSFSVILNSLFGFLDDSDNFIDIVFHIPLMLIFLSFYVMFICLILGGISNV